MAAYYTELFDWFAAGRLVPLEVETYPLERAIEAMAAVRDRRARGRVVLAIHES